jgi:phosphoglycolate phosphatase-like HAD superfamily hydrolase
MKYKATIFDLGGTLVRSASWSDYAEAVRKMATMLNASAEDFVKLWFDKWEAVINFLKRSHGAGTQVAVFPDATNQYIA